jgi:hypothetical protein
MPLPNNSDTLWNGYLVTDLLGQGETVISSLEKIIDSRNLPKVKRERQKLNMWWRKDSLCLDVTSEIDGSILCTVHIMDYGTSLFVGVAFGAITSLGNYYKRMAAAAFIETIDRCVLQAINEVPENATLGLPEIREVGKVGKFGG